MRTSQCIVRHLPFLAVLVGMMLFVSPSKALAQASSGNAGEYLYGTDFIFQYTEIDIDSSYDMDAWTDLYCPDFTLYERGLSLEADLSLFEDGYFIGADVNSGSSDIITDVFAVADPEHNYAADGAAVLWGYCETCYSYYNSIGLGDTWAYVTAPAAPPTIDRIDPTSGNIGDNRVLMHIYGDNLLGTGGASPTILSDSRTNMMFEVQGTSTKNQIDAYYWIASDASPVLGYIGVQTDGGATSSQNNQDFNVGYPDASNIQIDPNIWSPGMTTQVTLTGTNLGNSPNVTTDVPDIQVGSPVQQADGSFLVQVTVPSGEQATQANVTVSPGYNGCFGSCFSSTDRGNPSGKAQPVTASILTNAVCPTSISVGQTWSQPLSNDFPAALTGVGILSQMQLGPAGGNFDGATLFETVTPLTNSCPANLQSATNVGPTSFFSPFVVGNYAFWEGNNYQATHNAFYDQHVRKSAQNILDGTNVTSCVATGRQVYTCNGQTVGAFTLTYTYYSSIVQLIPVTVVAVSKQ